MNKQQARTERHTPTRLPFWGQLILITAILLSGEAFIALPAGQPAYAHTKHAYIHIYSKKKVIKIINIIVLCEAGNGGYGGTAIKKSSGASGGHGGNCTININPKMLASL